MSVWPNKVSWLLVTKKFLRVILQSQYLEYIIYTIKISITTITHEGRTRKSRSNVEMLKFILDQDIPVYAVENRYNIKLLSTSSGERFFILKLKNRFTETITCDDSEIVWDNNDASVLREIKIEHLKQIFEKGVNIFTRIYQYSNFNKFTQSSSMSQMCQYWTYLLLYPQSIEERFNVQRRGKVKFYEGIVIKIDNSAIK